MIWIARVGYFIAGACLTNAIPHLVAGLTGRAFPTQFSRHPGIGLSSPFVNFAWGWANALLGCLLLWHAGSFRAGSASGVVLLLAGSFVTGTILSVHFGNLFSLSPIRRKRERPSTSRPPIASKNDLKGLKVNLRDGRVEGAPGNTQVHRPSSRTWK